jgi:hypothetical protein
VNKRPFALLAVLPLLLAACAIGYQARGTLSDLPGPLRGKAFPGEMAGGGRFILADAGGRLRCDGRMAPPDSSPVPGSCQGESGSGVVRCTDGREMPVRWTAITCRAFEGSGQDKFGNRLIFRVDRSNQREP